MGMEKQTTGKILDSRSMKIKDSREAINILKGLLKASKDKRVQSEVEKELKDEREQLHFLRHGL